MRFFKFHGTFVLHLHILRHTYTTIAEVMFQNGLDNT